MVVARQVLPAFVPPIHYSALRRLERPRLPRSLLRGHRVPQSCLLPSTLVHVLVAGDLHTFQLNPFVSRQSAQGACKVSCRYRSIEIEDLKQLRL